MLTQSQQNREFIIEWNYKFPVDRWWRERYNIPLFSEQHLNANQLDIATEYQEILIFEEFKVRAKELDRKQKDYENGILVSSKELNDIESNNLFDKLNISNINKNTDSQLQFE